MGEGYESWMIQTRSKLALERTERLAGGLLRK